MFKKIDADVFILEIAERAKLIQWGSLHIYNSPQEMG